MMFVRFLALSSVACCFAGCATQGVLFDGHAEPRIARAADIQELEAVPEGYERVGRLAARCTLVEGKRAERGSLLVDVDCTESRLMAAVRERAAEVGGEALIARHCRSRISGQDENSTTTDISCDADVARPTGRSMAGRPLVSGIMAEDDAPRAEEAWRIRVHFTATPGVPYRAPRRADHVREVPDMPGANLKIGEIVTHCKEGCSRDGMRLGLIAAAGRMGASDVVDLHCAAKGHGLLCTATATAREADTELEPRAR
ncbi:MAG: hypothetical protein IPI67_17250 [Myxococcales bacterium]|nr:hypothetical protein [Myxococcales bacterium]